MALDAHKNNHALHLRQNNFLFQRIRGYLKIISILMLTFMLAPQKSWGNQIDPASIARILGGDNLPHPFTSDAEKSKKILDTLAFSETKLLDQGDKDWNSSSPKWKPVYDHIRADFESEWPSIMAASNAAAPNIEHNYETEIASHLTPSDVDTILAYYNSPPGQRYEAFMRRIDLVMSSGGAVLLSGPQPSSQANPTPEQTRHYLKMLMLSRVYQSMMALAEGDKAAHRDTTGSGVIGFFAGAAINKNQPELENLYKEYVNDLPAFESFSKTDASQHLFKAMALAMPKLAKIANPISDTIKVVRQKHEDEWKALYQVKSAH